MDIVNNLALGLSVALVPQNILYCFLGTLAGTLVGILPGIGPLATIAILLPITFSMAPESSLIMLAGIYYGAQYGGSTTAILLNLPGESSSAVTTLDGYQMARRGRAGEALVAAALASFFAGTVATVVVALFAGPLTRVALAFGPPEYFSLMVLGLLLGTIGTDIYTGSPRLNFGLLELADGVNFIALAVGIYGIGEILRNLENEETREAVVSKVARLWLSATDFRRIGWPTVRGTVFGSFLGILPGGGALLSSFAAYAVEKRISPNKAEFGQGAIEGVAAPESANNAGAQTSFIPMLTLGLPSNGVMALMIGAMLIQGIVPGPNIINNQPQMFWGLIASMWVGNLLLVLLNLPLVRVWVRLLAVPYQVLFVAVAAFSAIGIFSVSGTAFSLWEVSVFAILGYVFLKLGCEPAPLTLGFILGPMMEEHLRRAMLMSRGDAMVFLQKPVSLGFLVAAALLLILATLPALARKREAVFKEE